MMTGLLLNWTGLSISCDHNTHPIYSNLLVWEVEVEVEEVELELDPPFRNTSGAPH